MININSIQKYFIAPKGKLNVGVDNDGCWQERAPVVVYIKANLKKPLTKDTVFLRLTWSRLFIMFFCKILLSRICIITARGSTVFPNNLISNVCLQGVKRCSPITGCEEFYYPSWKRAMFRWLVSLPVCLLCLCFVFLAMLLCLQLQVSVGQRCPPC